MFHWKIAAWGKIYLWPFKNTCEGVIAINLLSMMYYSSHKISRCQNLPHVFQTIWTIVISHTQDTKLIKLYRSHFSDILIVRQLIVNEPSDKKSYTVPVPNFSHTPKPMQRHYELSKNRGGFKWGSGGWAPPSIYSITCFLAITCKHVTSY